MRRRVDPRQQELFSPSYLNPAVPLKRVQTQVTHDGLYLGSVSPFTGGPLNAIEGARVQRGLSIAKAGLILWCEGPVCFFCLKGKKVEGQPLYRAVSRSGKVKGDRFRCTTCNRTFTAHRDECWSSPR